MELRQFAYFEAVVDRGGFTRAGTHLHVAQTAVSAQIRKLESELGVELLIRTTRRVQLTRAGELVLARARSILHEVDGIRADTVDVSALLTGLVRLGAVDAVEPFDLDAALAAFVHTYPGLALRLRTAPTAADLLTGLDNKALDFVLTPAPPDLPDKYVAHNLFSEQLVIITPVRHRISQSPAAALSEFRNETFISFPPGTGLRRILDDAADAAGFEPQVPFETTSLTRIRGLVSNGLGVALVPESIATQAGPPVHTFAIDPHPIRRSIALIRHRDHAQVPAAHACWLHLATWRQQAKNG